MKYGKLHSISRRHVSIASCPALFRHHKLCTQLAGNNSAAYHADTTDDHGLSGAECNLQGSMILSEAPRRRASTC
jgi:hypothetical protein